LVEADHAPWFIITDDSPQFDQVVAR